MLWRSARQGLQASRKIFPALLAFSLLLGLMTTYALELKNQQGVRLNWDGARWITAPDARAVSYFRKVFIVRAAPYKAFLKLAGTENYKLYINGVEIAVKSAPTSEPIWLGAVESYLRPGRNVIAVRVEKSSLGGAPAMILSLRVQDSQGQEQLLVSDNAWKASFTPASGGADNRIWYQYGFYDADWRTPHLANGLEPPSISGNVDYGYFLWSRTSALEPVWRSGGDRASEARFVLTLPFSRAALQNAWLMTQCNGTFKVNVNQRRLGDYASDYPQIKVINLFQPLGAGPANKIEVFADCDPAHGIGLQAVAQTGEDRFISFPGIDWRVSPVSATDAPAHYERPAYTPHIRQVSTESVENAPIRFEDPSLEVMRQISYPELILRALKWCAIWLLLNVLTSAGLLLALGGLPRLVAAINLLLTSLACFGALLCALALDARLLTTTIFNLSVVTGLFGAALMSQAVSALQLRSAHFEPGPVSKTQQISGAGVHRQVLEESL
ncbi:hypothetical protein HCH_06178 [Hahella chejuensis KCTC 2396]|uniref:Uncharacterized protein n=1 Tax=Hahella chejuensis (strain KCTC 2396) TaxID=349521 RepID=Q2S951_HAHCH|nr:hypothetical protein [Hahella chejuensis]ABC32823.1 hypothetical protein HCH_06178 [Hahella chejuensis KCTC 2396]